MNMLIDRLIPSWHIMLGEGQASITHSAIHLSTNRVGAKAHISGSQAFLSLFRTEA